MNPEHVTSPQKRLRNIHVIHDDGHWSVATVEWLHEHNDQWGNRVGIRWNGADDELGNPQSSGNATWFLLPEGSISDTTLAYAYAKATMSFDDTRNEAESFNSG